MRFGLFGSASARRGGAEFDSSKGFRDFIESNRDAWPVGGSVQRRRRSWGARARSAVPRGQATANVSRIEAALPQRRGHVAADFKAIRAVHDHRGLG